MGKPFNVNINRFDPYKTFRFLVFFGTDPAPVAGVTKISALKRSTDLVEYKEAGTGKTRKGLGRTKYEPITLERGLTHESSFEDWANATEIQRNGEPATSLKNLRREVRISLLNEQGAPVYSYVVHKAWVSEYQALPDLDAGTNAIAIEHIKIEHEGWERDQSVSEPTEL